MSTYVRPTVFMAPPIEGEKMWSVLAMVTSESVLFMRDAAGEMVESYDWERFGRIVYRSITGREAPEQLFPVPDRSGRP